MISYIAFAKLVAAKLLITKTMRDTQIQYVYIKYYII